MLSENRAMLFQLTRKRIRSKVEEGRWLEAQRIAHGWAYEICNKLGVHYDGNWKFFKRTVVAKWFGTVENKRFESGWSVDEALRYADSFPGHTVRLSLFPNDIACHAKSFRLLSSHKEEWRKIIEQVDRSVPMEIFPEASTAESICFRRFETKDKTELIYEAGKGQAMYVFEQEQGRHSIVAASRLAGKYTFSKRPGSEDLDDIEGKLRGLIKSYNHEISRKCQRVFEVLGVDYLSIEGYFDPQRGNFLVIVDIDLPFDLAFMGHDPE